jgi:hypothetical protein
MSYGTAVRDELRVPTRELRHAIPMVYAGYNTAKALPWRDEDHQLGVPVLLTLGGVLPDDQGGGALPWPEHGDGQPAGPGGATILAAPWS